MQTFTSIPKPVLLALAILFGIATMAYSILWMIHVHHIVALGADLRWLTSHEAEVKEVQSGVRRGKWDFVRVTELWL